MLYRITKYGHNGVCICSSIRKRRDAAALLCENTVYDCIKAMAWLDTVGGRVAADKAKSAYADTCNGFLISIGDYSVAFTVSRSG